MFTQLIIRLMTPLIVEVIKELLQQLAKGEVVSLNEETVKAAMEQREDAISKAVASATAGL
jgi:hypothetical protein